MKDEKIEKAPKERKKMNFFAKAAIYLLVLVALFAFTVWGTKYYFYDSDFSIKKTDLSQVKIDGISLGKLYTEIDTSKYTTSEEARDDCNFNFEEISFKTDSKGVITKIVAPYKKVTVLFKEGSERASKINDVWKELGENYDTFGYKTKENNYWKITKYNDVDNEIYLGVVYSRFNNEISEIIMSHDKIKD